MKITVLIRVYDRLEDLKQNLQIIRNTWTQNDYYIIVVSNGKSNGFHIDADCYSLIDKLVILEENAGHRKGNSQLLLEGIKYIPDYTAFTLILEADTWVYQDTLITKYTNLLAAHKKKVWASADWYDKYYALATDFAIIKTDFVKQHPELFDFDLFPECHVCNIVHNSGREFIWITENMPVHIPSYVPFGYPYVPNIKEKRFYVFPKSRTVTHHIEFLKHGIEDKKRYFNIVAGLDYFEEVSTDNKKWNRFKMYFWINLSKCFFKRSWYSKKVYKEI